MLSRIRIWVLLFLLATVLTASLSAQRDDGLVAWWRFDEGAGNEAKDSVSGSEAAILNHHAWAEGVLGRALKFDGFTTLIDVAPAATPRLQAHFSLEAWIAMQSHPWNWVALVDQEKDQQKGYFFGIDSEGRLSLQVSVWGNWEICESQVRVPLKQWTHVAATYDSTDGIRLYIDGKLQGKLPVTGGMTPANDNGLRIGRNFKDLPATAQVRHTSALPALYSFDGIIDELKIYDRTLSPEEIARAYAAETPASPPELSPRTWPALPQNSKQFGASYTNLKLYPEWDALWRMGPYADVVVSFAGKSFHYVFWHGSNYGETMVTQNGVWIGDQSFESHTQRGTAEHMNDKHDRYSHISIVENSDARVVLHWRYALADVLGEISNADPQTGWGDWVDEFFYIYPDGVAVRDGSVQGTARKYSFTEPTILVEAGKKAEDYISLDAATIANRAGEGRTYSWASSLPSFPFPDQPSDANIAELNVKSNFKPFYIYRPGMELGPYGWPPELRPEYSHFPTWDHWPVNQIPSDGRFEMYPDHFGSAAILSPNPKQVWDSQPGRKSTYFLFGLTNQTASDLAALDRSWLQPPALRFKGRDVTASYDPSQRAYILISGSKASAHPHKIEFTIEASASSPVVNPAFVFKNWGEDQAEVKIKEARLPESAIKTGFVHRLDGTDLVIWIPYETERFCHVIISAGGAPHAFFAR